jgi:hypothetical protein
MVKKTVKYLNQRTLQRLYGETWELDQLTLAHRHFVERIPNLQLDHLGSSIPRGAEGEANGFVHLLQRLVVQQCVRWTLRSAAECLHPGRRHPSWKCPRETPCWRA